MAARKLPRGTSFALLSVLFLALGTIYIYFLYPLAAAGQEQPIPFSHRLHVSVKQLDCTFCHNTVERTRNAGMPSVDKCLYCHQHIIPEHPQIQKLRGYAERGEPVPWEKVTFLPDHVYFSHQRHIQAGVSCIECHGDVGQMDRVKEVFPSGLDESLLLGSPFKMGFCLDCHHQGVEANSKIIGHEQAKTDAELIRDARGTFTGTRAPVDCWTCHQ